MLLTNLVVENFKEAMEKVDWYKLRWTIEVFHKILKSGCQVEACRLQTGDRLKRYITICSIIAWRLHWMTFINRTDPQKPCTVLLENHEWKALYGKINKTSAVPNDPPTVRVAVRWIAMLGGFLARKNDGEPGIITIWRGWQRLSDIADDFILFSPT